MATVEAQERDQVLRHTSPCTAVLYILVSGHRDVEKGFEFGEKKNLQSI